MPKCNETMTSEDARGAHIGVDGVHRSERDAGGGGAGEGVLEDVRVREEGDANAARVDDGRRPRGRFVHAGAGMGDALGVEGGDGVRDTVRPVVGGVVVSQRGDIDAGGGEAAGETRRDAERVGLRLLDATVR
jgi:hypothetical protein